ncbi:MAG: mannose-1-phosphate guanylyltransferase/mannose-6-phosphate isomerase [Gammaproteobacteria bacterium]|nr:mannose-1-phosphate guanylyltransferase/mannose-6-phosphate isomerase [Gammaproteobacteria bacterium]
MIVPVILAGGSGTRLWPLSRTSYPKQLLSLIDDNTLLQNTLLRLQSIHDISAPIIICSNEHRFLIAEQLQEIGIHNASIILEPEGKNTAPAAAIAALAQRDQNNILLVLPADHFISDVNQFTSVINHSISYAEENKLVTYGITPTRADTGYGYIKTTTNHNVESFIEKPNLEKALEYFSSGSHYWNSGIFMFRASAYLAELETQAPDILFSCRESFNNAVKDLDFIRLDQHSFKSCRSDSIDYAIMEKTNNAVLLPLDAGWSDIGSWSALYDAKQPDSNGNVLQGDVIIEDVKNSYLSSTNRLLAVVGVSDHIIIETSDAVLVAHKDKSQDIKKLVAQLKQKERPEAETHQKIFRPWGYYEILHQSENFKVKRISIKPGAAISLQMHLHRSEHWVVVAGQAQVTRGDDVFILSESESTYIPKTVKHRLANLSAHNVEIIETQLGNYLGEDDIVRYEDTYGRMTI